MGPSLGEGDRTGSGQRSCGACGRAVGRCLTTHGEPSGGSKLHCDGQLEGLVQCFLVSVGQSSGDAVVDIASAVVGEMVGSGPVPTFATMGETNTAKV